MASLPSRNYTFAIAVKKHAKVVIKLFLSCPILQDVPNILSKINITKRHRTRNIHGVTFCLNDISIHFISCHFMQTLCYWIVFDWNVLRLNPSVYFVLSALVARESTITPTKILLGIHQRNIHFYYVFLCIFFAFLRDKACQGGSYILSLNIVYRSFA